MEKPDQSRWSVASLISIRVFEVNRTIEVLLVFQWLVEIALAVLISPLVWKRGQVGSVSFLTLAGLIGGVLTLLSVYFLRRKPGLVYTRHVVAVCQMLHSSFLVFLTGGRPETHFHIFGSLAILAFYLDWRVLVTASGVIAVEHLARGLLGSIVEYPVTPMTLWRSIEFLFWIGFENFFLTLLCLKARKSLHFHWEKQHSLSQSNKLLAEKVEELERSQAALRDSEAKTQRLFQSNIIGNFFADLSGGIIEANNTFLKLMGYTQSELPILDEDKKFLSNRDIGQLVMTGSFGPIEKQIKRKDGNLIPALIGGALLETQEDRCICFALDLTGRKKLEAQFLQSQKSEALGRMAGGVAHDFNNLLAVIMGNADLIRLRSEKSSPIYKLADVIFTSSKTGSGVTKQLLAMTRKQPLNKTINDINKICRDLQAMLSHLLGESHSIQFDLIDGLAPIETDENQFQQVILNLVMNAKDAMLGGGVIEVRTMAKELQSGEIPRPGVRPGKYVGVSVKDTGHGIPADVLPHLFEPFFTTKGPEKGTGLGLATVQGIVEQSGGFVIVETAPHVGSVFSVYFPAQTLSVSQEKKDASQVDEIQMGWETILLVEDKPEVRKVASEMLLQLGYQVIEADSPESAIKRVKNYSDPIHLLLTDVVMPGMSGVALAEQLSRTLSEIRVVFISGFTSSEILPETIQGVPTQFVSKPFTFERLGGAVRRAIDWHA